MARVLGVDLGAHSVKVATLQVGFRVVKIERVQTLEVSPGAGSAFARSLAALAAIEAVGEHDMISVAIPGDRVLMRLLDIPFSDPRKLQAVVGNELADNMPWDVEDVVFDHLALPAPISKVLAAAARSDEIGQLLQQLAKLGVVPRHVAVAPLSYGGLIHRQLPSGLALVVDIGHLRTNVCFVRDGRPLMGRTISRGGHQLTEGLRQVLQLSYAEAEALKHGRALLSTNVDALPQGERQLATATGRAFAPLARELRQTAAVFSSRLNLRPEQVVLCGGTSLLRGVEEYVSAELATPALRLSHAGDAEFSAVGISEEGEVVSAQALGIALEHGRPALDMRQGHFAFKTDRSVFRDKLLTLAASVLAVLILAAISAYASLHALHKEELALRKELRRQTRRVFGTTITNPKTVIKRARRGVRSTGQMIPARTAVDILDMLSKELPQGKKVKIDVNRLDIKRGKTYLKGTADSQSTVGKIVRMLKGHDCFSEVVAGKISATGDGKREFTLTATTTCF